MVLQVHKNQTSKIDSTFPALTRLDEEEMLSRRKEVVL